MPVSAKTQFNTLVRPHLELLYRVAYRLVRNQADAQDRLHAMLRDTSTPSGLWLMALVNLQKYGKLQLDLPELLAAAKRIGRDDPALEAQLMNAALQVGRRPELMHQVRDQLLTISGDERRSGAERDFRLRLVMLLADELSNEPGARAILESVAASDPAFEVRAAAQRALGAVPR